MQNTPESCSDAEATPDGMESKPRSMNYNHLDAEKVLKEFGNFGAYQVCLFIFFQRT